GHADLTGPAKEGDRSRVLGVDVLSGWQPLDEYRAGGGDFVEHLDRAGLRRFPIRMDRRAEENALRVLLPQLANVGVRHVQVGAEILAAPALSQWLAGRSVILVERQNDRAIDAD